MPNREKEPVIRKSPGNPARRFMNPYIANDFKEQDTWRMFRIMSEFVEGFETLRNIRPAVTLFGSARTQPESRRLQAGPRNRFQTFQKGFYHHHRRGARHHGGRQPGRP